MANLNRVLLIGRLTRDPELRYTPAGLPIADMGLAVNNRRKGQDGNWIEEPVFVDVTAFGRTAELAHQYLAKGRQTFVEGHLRLEQWTSPEGQKRSKLSVIVDNLQFLDSRGDATGAGGGAEGAGRAPSRSAGPAGGRQGGGYRSPPSDYGDAGGDEGGMGPSPDDVPF